MGAFAETQSAGWWILSLSLIICPGVKHADHARAVWTERHAGLRMNVRTSASQAPATQNHSSSRVLW